LIGPPAVDQDAGNAGDCFNGKNCTPSPCPGGDCEKLVIGGVPFCKKCCEDNGCEGKPLADCKVKCSKRAVGELASLGFDVTLFDSETQSEALADEYLNLIMWEQPICEDEVLALEVLMSLYEDKGDNLVTSTSLGALCKAYAKGRVVTNHLPELDQRVAFWQVRYLESPNLRNRDMARFTVARFGALGEQDSNQTADLLLSQMPAAAVSDIDDDRVGDIVDALVGLAEHGQIQAPE